MDNSDNFYHEITVMNLLVDSTVLYIERCNCLKTSGRENLIEFIPERVVPSKLERSENSYLVFPKVSPK